MSNVSPIQPGGGFQAEGARPAPRPHAMEIDRLGKAGVHSVQEAFSVDRRIRAIDNKLQKLEKETPETMTVAGIFLSIITLGLYYLFYQNYIASRNLEVLQENKKKLLNTYIKVLSKKCLGESGRAILATLKPKVAQGHVSYKAFHAKVDEALAADLQNVDKQIDLVLAPLRALADRKRSAAKPFQDALAKELATWDQADSKSQDAEIDHVLQRSAEQIGKTLESFDAQTVAERRVLNGQVRELQHELRQTINRLAILLKQQQKKGNLVLQAKLKAVLSKIASFNTTVDEEISSREIVKSAIADAVRIRMNDFVNRFDKSIDEIVASWSTLVKERDQLLLGYEASFQESVSGVIVKNPESEVDTLVADSSVHKAMEKTESDIKQQLSAIDIKSAALEQDLKERVGNLQDQFRAEILYIMKLADLLPIGSDARKHAKNYYDIVMKHLDRHIRERVNRIFHLDINEKLRAVIQRLVVLSNPKIKQVIAKPIVVPQALANFEAVDGGLGYYLGKGLEKDPMDDKLKNIPFQVAKDMRRGFYGKINIRGSKGDFDFDSSNLSNRNDVAIQQFCESLRKGLSEITLQRVLFLHMQGALADLTKAVNRALNPSGMLRYVVTQPPLEEVLQFDKHLDMVFDENGDLHSNFQSLLSVKVVPENVDCYVVVEREIIVGHSALEKAPGVPFTKQDVDSCKLKFTLSPLFSTLEEANAYGAKRTAEKQKLREADEKSGA